MYSDRHIRKLFILMILIFFAVLALSFVSGRYAIDTFTLFKVLLSKAVPIKPTWSSQTETVLFKVRLPRVTMACLIGAGLSCAGAAYQGIFHNPMVSPDVLGASAGAGFGAALGIFFGFDYRGITLSAFTFGISAVLLVCMIASRVRKDQVLGMVLTGIMIGSLCSSATSFIKLVCDPSNVLPAITYWLMGSLASIRIQDVRFAAPLIIIGIIPILLLRWRINVLTIGDDEAKTMGINIRQLRICIVLSSTLIVAASVSVSGMIGWVGLVIPHFARILTGSDYRRLLPASILLGSTFLLIVDYFARTITTSEIPIGILTSFVGVPFFLYLILKEGNRI